MFTFKSFVFALCAMTAFGQSSRTPIAFEAEDVHASARTANPYIQGGTLRGQSFDVKFATMADLIGIAYGVDSEKVLGGPSWLEADRFDLSARAPEGSSPEKVKQMLQSLLANRFKLAVHTDTRPVPAFVLSQGKGKPKLKQAQGSGPSECKPLPQHDPEPGSVRYTAILCRNENMSAFAQFIESFANKYLPDRVIDSTGLEGAWDFELKWTAKNALVAAGADGISLFDAVDKQLGLKLESQKVSAPVIVVDSANQVPTPNGRDVSGQLPPPPLREFSVAVVKASRPNSPQTEKIQNDLFNVQSWPLKLLIIYAWDLGSETLLSGPRFLESARFDITAKAAEGERIQIDELRMMLRSLLEDRFKLKTHVEQRPVDGYLLSAVKPKLQKANPAGRTGCKEGPGADGKDPRIKNPILSRLLTCQNMSLKQFSEDLPTFAGGYIQLPVLDSTDLDGAYDFTISFSAYRFTTGGAPGRPSTTGPGEATAPSGAVSLAEALNKQLGLKLEMHPRPMPVLVVDHVEEQPAAN